jgi:hypothetical protein
MTLSRAGFLKATHHLRPSQLSGPRSCGLLPDSSFVLNLSDAVFGSGVAVSRTDPDGGIARLDAPVIMAQVSILMRRMMSTHSPR